MGILILFLAVVIFLALAALFIFIYIRLRKIYLTLFNDSSFFSLFKFPFRFIASIFFSKAQNPKANVVMGSASLNGELNYLSEKHPKEETPPSGASLDSEVSAVESNTPKRRKTQAEIPEKSKKSIPSSDKKNNPKTTQNPPGIKPGEKKAVASSVKAVKVLSLEEALVTLKNRDLKEVINYLRTQEHEMKLDTLELRFRSEKELVDILKENAVNFLRNRYGELKDKISLLRKSGKDVEYEWLKLMRIPPKIKVFEINVEKEDFEKVIQLLNSLEKELKEYDAEKPKTDEKKE